mgnify:CR=1 FL=1
MTSPERIHGIALKNMLEKQERIEKLAQYCLEQGIFDINVIKKIAIQKYGVDKRTARDYAYAVYGKMIRMLI